MATQKGSDDLFEIKNAFYIGNYQHCINEALKIKTHSLEKDIFMYRAYIAQHKYRIVLDEIKPSNESGLLAVRFLADYFAEPSRRDQIVKFFDEKVAAETGDVDDIWMIAAATVYYHEGLFESALKILHGVDGLECLALAVQILLRIGRADLARKTFARMQERDDDATLTQLAQAWINIEVGGDKLQDAYYVFQDFADKFSPSVQLLNSQAVCHIGQGKYEDADLLLRECLERNPNDYDTLVNLVAVAPHTEKSAEVQHRHLTNLKDSHRDSPLVVEYAKKEAEFERLCKAYAPSKVSA